MATRVEEIATVNPATGAEIERFPLMSGDAVDAAIAAVDGAAPIWAATPLRRRGELLREAARVLRSDESFARAITEEMGKPITESRAEVEKCAFVCEHYADHAAEYLADEPAPSDSPNSFIAFEPLGTVLAVMPWNFPLWQVFRFAAPGLMAGNTALLKHASNTPRSALNCERVFREAGFPDVFRTLLIGPESVGGVIADPRVAGVTLTGSEVAGSQVAAIAGQNLKKTVLELGGSDAFLVLEDADVDQAAATAVRSRFQNCGQSCIAAKRFIVDGSIADAFEDAMVAAVERLRVGDPAREETQMGPLARDDLRDSLRRQLDASVSKGARILTGGTPIDSPGWFFRPTVVGDCRADMPVVAEETFGPLAAVIRVDGDDAAVSAANASPFGLGGNIWTGDVERGVRLARRLHTGGVFINGMTHSDPRLPFGGVRRSGYGRELHAFGIREFVNIKTIWRP